MTTAPEMSRHTPDRNAGVLSGHGFLWPVNAPAPPAAGVDLAVRHQTLAVRHGTLRGPAELTGTAG